MQGNYTMMRSVYTRTLFAIGIVLAIAIHAKTFAAPVPGMSQSAASVVKKPELNRRRSDLQALDRVLSLLKDDAARAALVGDLEKLRSTIAAQTTAAKGAKGQEKKNLGLLAATANAITSVGRELPEKALGDPIDEEVGQVADQVQARLEEGLEEGYLQRFFLTAVPGWLLAFCVALAAWAALRFWRGKTTRADVTALTDAGKLTHSILRDAVWGLLPFFCAAVVIALWPVITGLNQTRTLIFLTLVIPIMIAGMSWQTARALLAFLGPTRGWRKVTFAQRQLVPWVSGLSSAISVSVMLRESVIRDILGADASNLSMLFLDLAIGCFGILFILIHRKTVRSLIAGKREAPADPTNPTPFWRVIRILANHWHLLGIAFVLTNMAARVLGLGGGNFVTASALSMLTIIVGLMITFSVDSRLAKLAEKLKQDRFGGVLHCMSVRYLQPLRILAQAAFVLLIAFLCLNIWGFDVESWFDSKIGWAVIRPLRSILITLAIGWILWIAFDSFVENALSAVDRYGRSRTQSSRTKTLLPFLRNVAFVALSAIMLVVVLANLGINIAPLLAGAGIVGLAIGFGSQQLVQDLITGLFILFEDTIAVGDLIDTGDRAGTVEALTIRTVKIRDADGALHSIPFSQIKALKNRSRGYGFFTLKIAVGYESNLDEVMDIMREIGKEMQNDPTFSWKILAPLEIWGVDQFAPDGVVIMGGIKTRALDQWSVGREFNLRLKKRFDVAGIVMTLPRVLFTPRPDAGDGKADLTA